MYVGIEHSHFTSTNKSASRHVIVGRENRMLHLRMKAYLQAVCSEKRWSMEMLPSIVVLRCLLQTSPCIDVALLLSWFSMLLNFWICSCMLNGVTGRPSLQCCQHHLHFIVLIISLLSLFCRFPFCPKQNIYRNIVLLKSLWNYLSNVWSFIENGVQTRELCPFYFSAACCPKQISGRVALGNSGITACTNLRLSWFLICWNRNFIGLLNIQKYSVFSLRDHTKFWWDQWFLAHWSSNVNDLDHSIF
jgi:hypothetical protein